MTLEYSLEEPKIFEMIKIKDLEYLFEIRTFAEINQFGLTEELNGLSFKVTGENEFVTAVVPVNFLAGPYEMFLNEEKIFFHDYLNNGTHVWINIRPESSGDVTIIGTVVPDMSEPPTQDSLPFVFVGMIIVVGIIVAVILTRKKQSKV